jgi:hypothetical protein
MHFRSTFHALGGRIVAERFALQFVDSFTTFFVITGLTHMGSWKMSDSEAG